MNDTIAIFEPIYTDDQIQVETAFLPLILDDNARSAWREFRFFVDLYRSGEYLRHDRTGIFSPKFGLKTKMTGANFIRFIEDHPEADVHFVNPFPQIAYWSFNVWKQGEYAHPGLTDAAQALLDACGLGVDLRNVPRHGPGVLAYSNFWVGSQRFWCDYVGGVLMPIAEFLEQKPTHAVAHKVMKGTSHTDPAPFLPFIVERLFSTFLSLNPELHATACADAPNRVYEYCVNDFERRLVARMKPRVDRADATGTFDTPLLDQMDIACDLWQQQFFDYFAVRPHPHTGRTVG